MPAGVSCPVGGQSSLNHARGLPAPAFSPSFHPEGTLQGHRSKADGGVKESGQVSKGDDRFQAGPESGGVGVSINTVLALASSPPKLCALDHVRLQVCSQAAVGGASSSLLSSSLLPCGLGLRPD